MKTKSCVCLALVAGAAISLSACGAGALSEMGSAFTGSYSDDQLMGPTAQEIGVPVGSFSLRNVRRTGAGTWYEAHFERDGNQVVKYCYRYLTAGTMCGDTPRNGLGN